MNRRSGSERRVWPATAIALYGLGLFAVLTVSMAVGGAVGEPERWALVAFPVLLMGTASLVVRRGRAANRR